MEFRIAETFTASLARLTGDGQKFDGIGSDQTIKLIINRKPDGAYL